VLIVLLAGLFLTLPFLPALIELLLKRDGQPLNVIQKHEGEIRYFSQGFRAYVAPLLESLRECVAQGASATGTMPDGLEYHLLGRTDDTLLRSDEGKEATCRSVEITGTDVILPDGVTFPNEIYAAGEFIGGGKNIYRSLFGEKNVQLGQASTVIRWAHAVGALRAEPDCDLYGRISSDREIQLQSGCAFQRLNAPRIALGRTDGEETDIAPEIVPTSRTVARGLFDGDLDIKSGEIVSSNIVTRGKLHIGAGARVLGSVKAHEHLTLGAGVTVDGSLISASTMRIGPDCQISGPIIAEHEMSIEKGTRCGSARTPTTVSAPTIQVAEGVVVYGTLWARNEGQVVRQG
jgi:cytoskeletal protein CcmA (bactofilin family)